MRLIRGIKGVYTVFYLRYAIELGKMQTSTLLHADITQKTIGCAMRVHRYLGMGFPELIYKRALLVELEKEGINVRAEVLKDIYYNGLFIGQRRLDMIIGKKVLVELKAIKDLDPVCCHQVVNYLKIFEIEVGLLLNFGSEKLQFKRFICT